MIRIAILAILVWTWPVAIRAEALLVLENVARLDALACDGQTLAFAVAPPPPRQPAGAPPRFVAVTAGAARQAASLVLGLWRGGDEPAWLGALPDDATHGGHSVYAAAALAFQHDSLWALGGRNSDNEPIGRFWLARIDAATGKIVDLRRDRGPAGDSLATGGATLYFTRMAPRAGASGADGTAHLERLDGWQLPIRTGPGNAAPAVIALSQFFWQRHGLAAADAGVWAVGTFSGRVGIGDRTLDSPRPGELPLTGTFPPGMRESVERMFRSQPLPPLAALAILHASSEGRLRWVASVAPAEARFGGAGGLDLARVEGGPLLIDARGHSYLLGRYHLAIRSGDLRLARVGEERDGCFLATWDADGRPRWLRDLPCDGSELLTLARHGEELVAVNAHQILRLSARTGELRSQQALPAGEVRQGPGLRWQQACVAGGRLYLGGVASGEVSLAGRRLGTPGSDAVLLALPLQD